MYENAHCAYVNAHKNQCINTNIDIFFFTHNRSERCPESVTFLEILTHKSTDHPNNQPTKQPTNRPTDRPTNERKDGLMGKFHFQQPNNRSTDRVTVKEFTLSFITKMNILILYVVFFLLFCRHLSYSFFLLLICMSVCLSNLFS